MKSNSKIFIIIIPIIILIASFLYDNVIMIVGRNNYRMVTENIIKDVLTNSYADKVGMVIKSYEEKGLETEQLDVRYEDNILFLCNKIGSFSIFPSISDTF